MEEPLAERSLEERSTAHTPGPWRSDGPFVFASHGSVALCDVGGILIPAEEIANARLIAAAPHLLAACQAAEEWLSGWASAEPYIAILRAAISEATSSSAAKRSGSTP